MPLLVSPPLRPSADPPPTLERSAPGRGRAEGIDEMASRVAWYPHDLLPSLTTVRLHLRSLQRSDAGEVLSIHDDPDVQANTGETMHALDDALAYIDEMRDGVDHGAGAVWGISPRASGASALIGVVGLGEWNPVDRTAVLGYVVGRPHWRQGFAAEAVDAVLDFGFGRMRLRRIIARTLAANERSLRVLRRFDFRRISLSGECGLPARRSPAGSVEHELQLAESRYVPRASS